MLRTAQSGMATGWTQMICMILIPHANVSLGTIKWQMGHAMIVQLLILTAFLVLKAVLYLPALNVIMIFILITSMENGAIHTLKTVLLNSMNILQN